MSLKKFAYGALIVAAAFVIAIASATTGEAKGKKKKAAAAAPAPMAWCQFYTQPVCATRGKMKFTYANACFAAKDGAKVVSQKACPTKAAKKGKKMKKAAKKSKKKKKM